MTSAVASVVPLRTEPSVQLLAGHVRFWAGFVFVTAWVSFITSVRDHSCISNIRLAISWLDTWHFTDFLKFLYMSSGHGYSRVISGLSTMQWLLHGVEDTVDVKQLETKGQKKRKTIKTIGLRGGVLLWRNLCLLHQEGANAMQYNTKQYNANAMQMQCNAIQYDAIRYNTVQCNTMQYNAMQYNTIQCNINIISRELL